MFISRNSLIKSSNKKFNLKTAPVSNLLIDNINTTAKQILSENPSDLTPINLYNKIVSQKFLKPDNHQKDLVLKLDSLYHKIVQQKYPDKRRLTKKATKTNKIEGNFFLKLFAPSEKALYQADKVKSLKDNGYKLDDNEMNDPNFKGIYLYGSVGCGKTMVMDMFHTCLENRGEIKGLQRIHFNQFMIDVHKRLNNLRVKNLTDKNERDKYSQSDLIPTLAQELVNDAWVLCFDEFQVQDIADAMILRYLFREMWRQGVICIMTGNRDAKDFYKNGLQYKNFEPFIPMFLQNTACEFINSGIDYRKLELSNFGNNYILQSDQNAEEQFNNLLKDITGLASFDQMKPTEITVMVRKLKIKRAYNRIALFKFSELCSEPLAAQDYLAIAKEFDYVFIRDFPTIDMQTHRAEARRFITMIDNFYDCKIGTVFLAEALPENIFVVADNRRKELTDEERLFMDDLGILGTKEAEALSIISGEDESFALARLLSRLYEMKTQDYWDDVKRKAR